ncbi:hypothetical protein PR202_gb13325 [Eleusine coracana subsp. coracana]|uniref:At1g61320/AtMIF1 LRR domain-containing protein n=1 Tax=Eleusine coracana subsp. coracana TaxID=191504 RepID=A0AAV5ES90_ELECO|nr:hypothetical protein PR202_gb13325 [Eleusine coracana subsp. coracana]
MRGSNVLQRKHEITECCDPMVEVMPSPEGTIGISTLVYCGYSVARIKCFIHTADRHDYSVLDGLSGDQLHLRQIQECLRFDNLKNLRITRFRPSKSLVELTNHIVQNAPALSCVTLDTAAGCRGRQTTATNWCRPINTEMLRLRGDALRGLCPRLLASGC